MSTKTGTTISCDGPGGPNDRFGCSATSFGRTEGEARDYAIGWTRSEDGRDFCHYCSEVRANRAELRDLVPGSIRLMRVFDAAEAAGWVRRDGEEEDEAYFSCCGEDVEVDHLIGSPYRATCKKCGTGIVDMFGPVFSGGAVSFADSTKVNTETLESWALRSEVDAAFPETAR